MDLFVFWVEFRDRHFLFYGKVLFKRSIEGEVVGISRSVFKTSTTKSVDSPSSLLFPLNLTVESS